MRIAIIAIGTRGDIEPCMALGLGLRAAGHDIKLISHASFGHIAAERGLAFFPVAGDPRSALQSPQGHDVVNAESARDNFVTKLWDLIRPHLPHILRDCLTACQDVDLVLASPLGMFPGYPLTEKLGIPLVRAFYFPTAPTRDYPAFNLASRLKLGGRLNLLTFAVGRQMFWLLLRRDMNAMRRDVLQLPPLPLSEPLHRLDRQQCLLLYGYSPVVAPRPTDWGNWIHITGYWFLDRPETWSPPAELVDFIESGPAPVFVGFGSMQGRNPEATTDIVVKALRKAGQRAVLSAGWGGVEDLNRSDDLYTIRDIPHDWLFPRMAAVVHHGGAGTTGRGLQAGIPNIIVPFFGDQFFWGEQVRRLGAGPRPIPHRQLSVETVASAIRAVQTDPAMRKRAAEIGVRLRAEDGVGRAIEVLRAYLGTGVS